METMKTLELNFTTKIWNYLELCLNLGVQITTQLCLQSYNIIKSVLSNAYFFFTQHP